MTLLKEKNTDPVSIPDSNPMTLLHSYKPKNFLQWQHLRRSMGSQYHTPRVQRQLILDAQALGSAFYDITNPATSDL